MFHTYLRLHSVYKSDLCLIAATCDFHFELSFNSIVSVMQFPVILLYFFHFFFFMCASTRVVIPFQYAKKRIKVFDLVHNKVLHNAFNFWVCTQFILWTIYCVFFFLVCVYAVYHLFGHYFANKFLYRIANVVFYGFGCGTQRKTYHQMNK